MSVEMAYILVVDGDEAVQHLLGLAIRSGRSPAETVAVTDAIGLAEGFARTPWAGLVFDPATSPWLPPVRWVRSFQAQHPQVPVLVWSHGLAAKDAAELARCGATLLPSKDFASIAAVPDWWSETGEDARKTPPSVPRGSKPSPLRAGVGGSPGPATPRRTRPKPSSPETDAYPWTLAPDAGLPPPSVPRPQRPAEARPGPAEADPGPPVPHRSQTPRPAPPGAGPQPLPSDAEVETTRPGTALPTPPAELVHDLKEPLRAIEQLLQRCEKRHREILPQDAKTLIQSARRSAKQLTEQLEESMTLIPRAEPASSDANRVLSEGLQHLEVLRSETGARVTTDPLPLLAVSPNGLRRVFENLLSNAMRYRGAETPEIHVSAQVLDDEAIMSVADNGRGIPEALQDQLFDAGARGPDGGAGVGLSSARRVVERWGGEIWFDTVPGEGSTFFFSAPLVASPGPTGKKGQVEQKI
jgi:two-component sensor histidine kinase